MNSLRFLFLLAALVLPASAWAQGIGGNGGGGIGGNDPTHFLINIPNLGPTQLGQALGGACGVSPNGCTNAGPFNLNGLMTITAAPTGGGTTGTIVKNSSVYPYPTGDERARWWYTGLSVTGTANNTEEMDFYFEELSPLPIVSGAFSGSVGTVTATQSGGSVALTITTPGSDQPNGTYNLVFAGGGCGTPPAGTATVSGGAITSTNLTNAGATCSSNPTAQVALATVQKESNIVHPYGQIDSGINFTSLFDPAESSFENFGIMSGQYVSFNGIYHNMAGAVTTGVASGFNVSVDNQNATPGSFSEYDGILMPVFNGTGSLPTTYRFLVGKDPNAGSNIVGGVALGSLNAPGGQGTLSIYGPDNLSTTFPLFVRGNNSGALTSLFYVADNGNVAMPATATTNGPACFLSTGQIFDGQRCYITTLTQHGNFTLTQVQSGSHMDNSGSSGAVTFTLPTAATGLNYCFEVYAAQTLEVLAVGSDQIAIGASNSTSHNVTSNTPYSSLCIEAHGTGQWVAANDLGTWVVN